LSQAVTDVHDDPAAIDMARLPSHVAIIMDGNGRWAKRRGMPRQIGHRSGVEAIRRTVRAAGRIGLKHLTLYGFSSENWRRPAAEIDELMGLIKRFVRQDLAELHRHGVRIDVIGDAAGLEPDILKLIDEAKTLTRANGGLHLTVAFNYGARAEIVRALRRIAADAGAGGLRPADITEETVAEHLDTSGTPDPDLLIRTSGEQRVSNFLLWQLAYTEFVFTDVLWPDFGEAELAAAIAEFQSRERRFGDIAARTAL
jgi:undecaprenyl diphosphate synthase